MDPSAVCRFQLRNIDSDPVSIITGTVGGLIGNRIGRAVARDSEAVMQNRRVIGSVFRRGQSAATGARAGRIGGVGGALVGGVAGVSLQGEIEDLTNQVCGGN